jgi:pimeloyl-ACP methyl ester carboxylesterase
MLDRLRQVRAGVLDVGYVEIGPEQGQSVLLLHGWPYDIHSFGAVAPGLAATDSRPPSRSTRSH